MHSCRSLEYLAWWAKSIPVFRLKRCKNHTLWVAHTYMAPPKNSVGQRRLRYRIIGTQTKPDFQEQMKLIFYLKSILHVTSTREFWFVRLQVFSLFVQIKWGECMHASLKWLFLSLGHFARWTNEKEILLIVYWLVDFLSSPYNVILGVLLCMHAFCLHIIVSWDSLHLSTLLC